MKAIIEMPKGTMDKAEVDKVTGELKIDRKLTVSVPFNYGYIDRTLAEDGDALDIFVLGDTLQGLAEVETVPVGVFICKDQGVWDHKIVAIPFGASTDIGDAVESIGKYLMSYKPGFEVQAYTDNILVIMRVIRNSRLHRNTPVFKHESLGWRRFASILILAGLLALGSMLWAF